jgi:predicted ATP-grasp superfamily ATP-dependent carboligase
MLPVILLGGLNIVRALGHAGLPVIVATQDPRAPSTTSRYCTGVIELPPLSDRDAVIETLVRAARAYGTQVPLFYDNDDRLALVQDCRAALAPHFALLLNEPRLADALLEKSRFQALAERSGLPVPRRIEWSTLGAERGPILVKPRTRTAWDDSSVRLQLFGGAGKARVFANGKAARMDALLATLADKLQFQEYVPGGDESIWSFHGFAAPGGEVLAGFVGRKIRTYPALTGDSSYLQLEENENLQTLGRGVAARLGLQGIFKMDFKRSSDSGRFYLLEINTRFNLWHYLGAANGVNLPKVAYDFLVHGRKPSPAKAATRYRWLALREDWRAYREGQVGLAEWLLSLAYFPKVYDLFAWGDPLPFARYWTGRIRAAFSRRMTRWLAPAS